MLLMDSDDGGVQHSVVAAAKQHIVTSEQDRYGLTMRLASAAYLSHHADAHDCAQRIEAYASYRLDGAAVRSASADDAAAEELLRAATELLSFADNLVASGPGNDPCLDAALRAVIPLLGAAASPTADFSVQRKPPPWVQRLTCCVDGLMRRCPRAQLCTLHVAAAAGPRAQPEAALLMESAVEYHLAYARTSARERSGAAMWLAVVDALDTGLAAANAVSATANPEAALLDACLAHSLVLGLTTLMLCQARQPPSPLLSRLRHHCHTLVCIFDHVLFVWVNLFSQSVRSRGRLGARSNRIGARGWPQGYLSPGRRTGERRTPALRGWWHSGIQSRHLRLAAVLAMAMAPSMSCCGWRQHRCSVKRLRQVMHGRATRCSAPATTYYESARRV